ncbi:MAG: glutamine amidotransferase-related protein, partial [Bacteroidales bacterium]
MKRVLLIDNYDSFTYNLVQLVRESGVSHELILIRNDADPADFVMHFDKVILSPGPGLPDESGNLMQFIAEFAGKTDLLGICLGHQALA